MNITVIDCPNHVLSLILRFGREGEQYANRLVGDEFPRPTIYNTLDGLRKVGILGERLERSSGRGGIRRMFYLTPLGEDIYHHLELIDQLLRRS